MDQKNEGQFPPISPLYLQVDSGLKQTTKKMPFKLGKDLPSAYPSFFFEADLIVDIYRKSEGEEGMQMAPPQKLPNQFVFLSVFTKKALCRHSSFFFLL